MDSVAAPPPVVRPKGPAASPWKQALREAIRDPAELCRLLGLPPDLGDRAAAAGFGLLVPRGYAARMRHGDPADPLLRQVLPVGEETLEAPGFGVDPVGDLASQGAPGLLHKYRGRALLVTTGACAVHCRYCFRRHFPYEESPKGLADWAPAVDYLAADDSIHEVILSGGDPLSLVDETLARLADQLAAIPHLRRLRIHTRWPIVLPERVTDALVGWLTGTRLAPVVVVHANHAQELDATVAAALGRLARAGVPLLNQAVLLRGVNDSVVAQAELSERLIEVGVTPYYLHQLDRVAGAAHFAVPIEQGRAMVEELRARLPGYLVPRYVEERPGNRSKTPLDSLP
ncbi:L-lysine 2,3-aminomutase [Pirellulimonas nuda]|uniref:L-lysine 2,3-aminomutase n=1 Tax=Pirellulimonas nuda TaxID=2528009 RepID=A0A518D6R0_9BACT|nr:EF-P beta-lysylation protein EpmB [Pirellulimonas nuda]QDU87172.1 L-lysine 2,3-aminomutase [Pirellulimonas nuda]